MSITALAPRAATPGGRLADLSHREREVLSLMSIGRSNAGIAGDLLVSEGAVEKHVANIFIKLGLPPGARRPPPGARRDRLPGRALAPSTRPGPGGTVGAHGPSTRTASPSPGHGGIVTPNTSSSLVGAELEPGAAA